jgi:hypothetical protein
MFRAILCSSSGGQNCIFTASAIATVCERLCSAPVESGLLSGLQTGMEETVICCNNKRAVANPQWVQICVSTLFHEAVIRPNDRHHSARNTLCACWLLKKLKIKTCQDNFAFYFVWVWMLVCHRQREWHGLRVLKKGVLGGIFGTKVWKWERTGEYLELKCENERELENIWN